MREQGVSKSELARRLGLDEKEAGRMLNPRHAIKVPTLERALHALGKRVAVVVGLNRDPTGKAVESCTHSGSRRW